ncbi:uncharacterized protein LOC124494402 isoform X2 [Dermatophagoides farinae]|uniref:uncharacterized protein LOC124494402 isoform X2 n=1 Tax=Dermatophagoides farinae TaxID=6954 RepID=UPI003F639B9E
MICKIWSGYADPISNLRNGDNDDDYDDDSEETESSSEVEWNSTGYEPAVNHEDFELGRSFFDIVKDELPSELYSKFIEFCKSINKCRLQFHITQKAISSVHEAHKNIFELDSKNQKLQNFMTKFVNSIYLQKKFSENLPPYVKSEELKLTNGKKYHYIGIEKILKTHIIDDNLIRNIFDENQENLSEYVRKNGHQNKLRIVLSGDDFGVSNPIGGAERKLFALYMDTDNAKIYNTKANQLPLVLLCERSHITDLNELFSPVKRDLKRLMDNGITVQYNGIERKLEICLAYVLADNLGVCEMLGMKRNFSKGFICRLYKKESAKLSKKKYKSPYGIKRKSCFDGSKTAITTPFGLYEYTRLPFGLRNAPSTFQRFIDIVLRDLDFVFAYQDDILVASKNENEHVTHLDILFNKLAEFGLTISMDKSSFFKNEVKFLGHKISKDGISVLEEKLDAIINYPVPSTVKSLKRFLGMVNFYRRFIPNAAKFMVSLYDMEKVEGRFEWSISSKFGIAKISALAIFIWDINFIVILFIHFLFHLFFAFFVNFQVRFQFGKVKIVK